MVIADFLAHHWLDIILLLAAFFVLTYQWIPAHMAGLEKQYKDVNTGEWKNNRKQSILEAIMTSVFFTLNRSLLVVIGFRGATTILIFAVVGVELVSRHTISTNAVILAIVGLIALHFEQLVEQADEISIWKVFTYKRRK